MSVTHMARYTTAHSIVNYYLQFINDVSIPYHSKSNDLIASNEWNNVKGSGRGLILGSIPGFFFWIDLIKDSKPRSVKLVYRPRIERGNSQVQLTSIAACVAG